MSKKFAVIDCETDPFAEGRIPQPFIWGYYNPEDGFLKFNNTEELFKFLEGQDLRIYAHNGGKFDFHYMLEKIPSWEKIMMVNGRLAQFRVDKLEFCDSYCILPVPLSAYNKTEIDYNIFEVENRDIPKNRKLIEDYLQDDCVFTYELIEAFINENGYNLTIASAAIKKLQKIEDFKIKDSGRIFFDKMRPYYFGGRVECFVKGEVSDELNYFDINSAYPYAMMHEHPEGAAFPAYKKNPIISGHNFYKFTAKSLGAFPFRDDNGALTFPNDGEIREFHCTGWELITAKELNLCKSIKHIEQKIFFETRHFQKYVNYYYELKKNSPKGSPMNIFAKLFLNSAYGKFAADCMKYKETYIVDNNEFQEAIDFGFDIHGELHDRIIISKPNDESDWRHYNVATAASITGFVRAYLLKAIKSVEKPYYCDTDSLVFSGKNNLIINNELGGWKSEGNFHEGGIAGKKLYAFKNNDTGEIVGAVKGVYYNKKEEMETLYKDIINVCKGDKLEKMPIAPIYSLKKGKYFLKKTIAMT